MNDISNRLLFDGYKSLNSKIDDAHYQIDFIRKELEKIMTTVMDNSSRLDRRIDAAIEYAHDRIDDLCDECEECQETSDLSQELEKRIEVILSFCFNHDINLGQFKEVLNRMYKSYREMNG